MLREALLKAHGEMGVWPANNDDDPAPGLADVDLMGGSCGGAGSVENATTNDPGLLCQGNSAGRVAIGPSTTTGTFVTINATAGILRLWRGPYISKEIKSKGSQNNNVSKVDQSTRCQSTARGVSV